MRLRRLTARDFRGYESVTATFGEGVTIIFGPNGAGKTNLLEAVYFACTGYSCRTSNEREVVRIGASSARVVVEGEAEDGPHELSVGFSPGAPKRMRLDGAAVERLLDVTVRPLVSVFLPDRLDLIKGSPSLRRGHLDSLVAALWPARAATRRGYSQALLQRNALIGRIRSGLASAGSLKAWNEQLAGLGIALMADRRQAVLAVSDFFPQISERLGLGGQATISYRPRSRAITPQELADELQERTPGDIERGFTDHGPHRDDLIVAREGRNLRSFGSQGQQRLALLALLLAERHVIRATRDAPPVMLLDDVMSELDLERRVALVELLREDDGQALITTTELDHVPGATEEEFARIAVANNTILQPAPV